MSAPRQVLNNASKHQCSKLQPSTIVFRHEITWEPLRRCTRSSCRWGSCTARRAARTPLWWWASAASASCASSTCSETPPSANTSTCRVSSRACGRGARSAVVRAPPLRGGGRGVLRARQESNLGSSAGNMGDPEFCFVRGIVPTGRINSLATEEIGLRVPSATFWLC